ncbi:hypothetical protein E4U57_004960 [Claviceps arundinis]|uniref:EVE domain-containing protein n=1 Tax=Claviceps arundinis TaxID=1623583 RepID=A0ABQ7PID8_9HYPO|nr:hypothetical protein E4U57_004960 [Claviceps arundinis]
MPPRKRAATRAADSSAEPVPKRRSSRQAAAAAAAPKPERRTPPVKEPQKSNTTTKPPKGGEAAITKSPPDEPSKAIKASAKDASHGKETTGSVDVGDIPTINPEAPRHEGEWYWLMKAEPETRLENGIDVRFSIDDLKEKKEPEGWDGIRAYPARNHMRNMNAGDKAFFYHSNCKEPGIAGIMEIVKEFSEDTSAREPGAPYYDPKSTKDNPRWSLVHVEFRTKFAVPIPLKELRGLGAAGGPLENMQMLKQSRLSVSRVSTEEWQTLCRIADEKAKEAGLEHETRATGS